MKYLDLDESDMRRLDELMRYDPQWNKKTEETRRQKREHAKRRRQMLKEKLQP